MKRIRKVAVSPLPVNEAKVIDSFDTIDDKFINAPSINAVEGYVDTKLDNYYNKTEVDTELENKEDIISDSEWITPTITHSSLTSSTIKYRKIGKLIEITGTITINDNNYTSGDTIFTLPTGYEPTETMRIVCSAGGIATYVLIVANGGTVRANYYNDISTHNPAKFPSSTTLILNTMYFVD